MQSPPPKPAAAKKNKILITGTGRAGTTFLIRLCTLLGWDTGYKPETMENHVWKAANAGMERPIAHNVLIVKNPVLINTLDAQYKSFNLYVVIPLRDLRESAASRARLGKNPGGLWAVNTFDEQLEFYEKMLEKARKDIETYKIPHVYLNFKDMIASPDYLYTALTPMMEAYNLMVDPDTFRSAWERASEASRPRPENQKNWVGRRFPESRRAY